MRDRLKWWRFEEARRPRPFPFNPDPFGIEPMGIGPFGPAYPPGFIGGDYDRDILTPGSVLFAVDVAAG